jgi:hypothetical protein
MATSKASSSPKEEKKVIKPVSVTQPQAEKLVSFIPTATGRALVAQIEYLYTEGKEIKLPDFVAGVLTNAKQGHKK